MAEENDSQQEDADPKEAAGPEEVTSPEEDTGPQEEGGQQEDEPSMESILGSIRQILSEDEEEDAAEQPEVQIEAVPAPENGPDVDQDPAVEEVSANEIEPEPQPEPELENEIGDVMPEPELEPKADTAEPPSPQASEVETGEEKILELTQQMIAQSPSDVDAGAPILSGSTQTASTDPLQELARVLLSRRDVAMGSHDMTLEGLIREILRPLLREWLDQNLPYLIERLVKKEIDHMVNRAERLDL